MMKLKEVIMIIITNNRRKMLRLLQQQHTHTHTHDIHLLTGERKLGDGFLDTSTACLEVSCKALKTRLKSRLAGGNAWLNSLCTFDTVHERTFVVVQLVAREGELGVNLLNTAAAGLERFSDALCTGTQSLFAVRNTGSDCLSALYSVSDIAFVGAESFVKEKHLLGLLITLNFTIQLGNARTARSPV